MREILFRGRLKDTTNYHYVGWVYGSLVYSPSEDHYYIIEHCDNELSYPVDKETIGQFTGVCDKNGTKIFEGDILGFINNDDKTVNHGYVKYGNFNCSCCSGVYGWYLTNGDIRYLDDENSNDFYFVIGNIHDNHELLGESEND